MIRLTTRLEFAFYNYGKWDCCHGVWESWWVFISLLWCINLSVRRHLIWSVRFTKYRIHHLQARIIWLPSLLFIHLIFSLVSLLWLKFETLYWWWRRKAYFIAHLKVNVLSAFAIHYDIGYRFSYMAFNVLKYDSTLPILFSLTIFKVSYYVHWDEHRSFLDYIYMCYSLPWFMSNFLKSSEWDHAIWGLNESSNLIFEYFIEDYLHVCSLRIFAYADFLFFIVSFSVLE